MITNWKKNEHVTTALINSKNYCPRFESIMFDGDSFRISCYLMCSLWILCWSRQLECFKWHPLGRQKHPKMLKGHQTFSTVKCGFICWLKTHTHIVQAKLNFIGCNLMPIYRSRSIVSSSFQLNKKIYSLFITKESNSWSSIAILQNVDVCPPTPICVTECISFKPRKIANK